MSSKENYINNEDDRKSSLSTLNQPTIKMVNKSESSSSSPSKNNNRHNKLETSNSHNNDALIITPEIKLNNTTAQSHCNRESQNLVNNINSSNVNSSSDPSSPLLLNKINHHISKQPSIDKNSNKISNNFPDEFLLDEYLDDIDDYNEFSQSKPKIIKETNKIQSPTNSIKRPNTINLYNNNQIESILVKKLDSNKNEFYLNTNPPIKILIEPQIVNNIINNNLNTTSSSISSDSKNKNGEATPISQTINYKVKAVAEKQSQPINFVGSPILPTLAATKTHLMNASSPTKVTESETSNSPIITEMNYANNNTNQKSAYSSDQLKKSLNKYFNSINNQSKKEEEIMLNSIVNSNLIQATDFANHRASLAGNQLYTARLVDPSQSQLYKIPSFKANDTKYSDYDNQKCEPPTPSTIQSPHALPQMDPDTIMEPEHEHSDHMDGQNGDEPDQEQEPRATYSYLKSYFVSMLQPSDNKLAMKLFGSRKGVLKEKLRQQEVGHWIIHPCSNFRFYWDLVMLILLIANVIILPVAISFFNDNWSHTGLLIFNLVSDSMFLLDIGVNFRTGIFFGFLINLLR